MASTPPEDPSPAPPRRRILCVDDNSTIRNLVALTLSKANHFVECAGDGQQALQLITAADEPFDVLITDHEMPHLNGLQLVLQLKIKSIRIAIIVMSGNLDILEAREYLKLGVCRILEKPLMPQTILEAVRDAR